MASGVVLGAEIPNIEDMDIDPWADFEKISQSMGGSQLAPASVEDDYIISDDVGIMAVSDDDVGIMPLLTDSNITTIHLEGFDAYGVDEDGDDWEGVSVYSSAVGYPSQGFYSLDSATWSTSYVLLPNRPTLLNSKIRSSNKAAYVGRQALLSGDPDITFDTSYNFMPGSVVFDLDIPEPIDGCESFQALDVGFGFGVSYGAWNTSNSDGLANVSLNHLLTAPTISSVDLIINDTVVGQLEFSGSSKVLRDVRCFDVRVSSSVSFPKQRVSSASIAIRVSGVGFTSSKCDVSSGGCAVYVTELVGSNSDGSTWWMPTIQENSQFLFSSDSTVENTGLLKSIISFLQNIVDGITQLPGKIATAIIEGIKSLFIPSEDFITQWKEEFFTLLKERLGFICQCFEILGNFFDKFILGWGDTDNYVFTVPTIDFTVYGNTYVLFEKQEISLDNPAMDVLRPFAGTVVSIVTVLAFIHTMEDMFIAIISGWSYFSFMERGKEAEENGNTRNSE